MSAPTASKPSPPSTPSPLDASEIETETERADFRQRMVDAIPGWYSPWLHLVGTTLPGVVALGAAWQGVHSVTALEWLTVPVSLLLFNVGEWHVHRNVMHRRFPPLVELYRRHTPEHHRVYHHDDMAMRSYRELRLVLIPAVGVWGIALAAALLGVGAAQLFTPNVGWLLLATLSLYVLSYELSHLAYHLPDAHPVGRLGVVRWLREQHARHHDPRLMQRWNFNVTVPLFDWLFGTLLSDDIIDRQMKSRRERPGGSR